MSKGAFNLSTGARSATPQPVHSTSKMLPCNSQTFREPCSPVQSVDVLRRQSKVRDHLLQFSQGDMAGIGLRGQVCGNPLVVPLPNECRIFAKSVKRC